jgi:RimJ/RimL family protein N-acetyltransferase
MAESSKDPLYFTIIDKATGKVAGRQTLSRIRLKHGVIEMGHVLWSSLIARKPAATEACYLFAKHVFDGKSCCTTKLVEKIFRLICLFGKVSQIRTWSVF